MDKSQFRNNVKDLLNHLSDTAYLENRNLADLLLSGEEARQTNRVALLRNRVSESMELLRPPEEIPTNVAEWRCYRILSMRYLRGMELYRIEDELGLSQRQVQRDLKKGVDALVSILWDQLPAAQKSDSAEEAVLEETQDSYDLELIQKELMGWEITFDLFNLCQIIEQALQLSESLLETDMHSRVDYSGVDEHLSVHVDQILTKQGMYKILGMVGAGAQDSTIQMRSRKLNDYFIELSVQFEHDDLLDLSNWQIAQLFFTIQGVNHALSENPGQTTVTIVLPLKRQNSCLVIDDVVSVRRLVERMLGSYGIQVFGTDDGQQALNLALLMKPDFILLDILMPKIDGWQMMKDLKSHPETSDIPVIICSVLYEPELSRKVGAAAYIRKPINRLELIQTLQEVGVIDVEIKDNSQAS
jgi:CheY-like chemotaxis protein